MNIQFIKSHDNPGGQVSGRLEAVGSPEQAFLGELNNVHPDFAAHVVKAVNTFAAIQKALTAQGAAGPLAAALRNVLARP